MTCTPRPCVVIPVFNHAQTIGRVARRAREVLPVIVVNDGSDDATGEALTHETNFTVVTLLTNQGKGAALLAGFSQALKMGFTHAITLDADGQHPTDALPDFLAACRRRPESLIVGVRDLKKDGAPWQRRLSNHLSSFWFKIETGVPLADTQCGYRCYPLQTVHQLCVTAQRYAWELEVIVKAAWAGVPLVEQPVASDYRAATSRLSHFRPWRDLAQVSLTHSRLAAQTFCVPALLRKLRATGRPKALTSPERSSP